MKAFILAAGVSRRLYPETYNIPKCLLDVGGKPIINYQLEALQNIGIDILLVDGEDMGVEGEIDSWGIGTQFFAREIPAPKPEFGICLDMVGDYSPEFLIEYYSYQFAPDIVSDVWSLANSIGYDEFKLTIGQPIIDDHYMLYKYGGVQAINIIAFN